MATLANIRIGKADISHGAVSLGHTLGEVTVTIERDMQAMTVDQYGTTPVDYAITGMRATITVPLAETNVDRLNTVIPEGAYVKATNTRIGLGVDAGYLLRDDAKQLIVHPTRLATADDSEDWTFYKTVSTGAVSAGYSIDGEAVWNVTFTALVDETYGNGRRLGHYGKLAVS